MEQKDRDTAQALIREQMVVNADQADIDDRLAKIFERAKWIGVEAKGDTPAERQISLYGQLSRICNGE